MERSSLFDVIRSIRLVFSEVFCCENSPPKASMLDQSAIDSDPVSFEPHLPTVNDCHGRVNSGQSLSGVGLDTPDTRPTLSATAASEVCVVVRDHTNVSQVRNRFLIQELMKESGDLREEVKDCEASDLEDPKDAAR